MADIHRQRRKDGLNRISEIGFQPRPLIRVKLVVVFQRNTRLRQCRSDLLFHDSAQHRRLALQLLAAELEFFAWRPPVQKIGGRFTRIGEVSPYVGERKALLPPLLDGAALYVAGSELDTHRQGCD